MAGDADVRRARQAQTERERGNRRSKAGHTLTTAGDALAVPRGVYAAPMGRSGASALYVAGMVVVIVAADVLFFRGHVWERLAANVGIVLVFLAFYARFLRHG